MGKKIDIEASEALISLEDFIKTQKPNKGLIASFRVEAAVRGDTLTPRTTTNWQKEFTNQSKKVYR